METYRSARVDLGLATAEDPAAVELGITPLGWSQLLARLQGWSGRFLGLTSGGGVDRVRVNREVLLGNNRGERGERGEDSSLTHCETGGTEYWGRVSEKQNA